MMTRRKNRKKYTKSTQSINWNLSTFFLLIYKKWYYIQHMIPFHKLYSWLFKSFNISWETILIERLINEWHQKYMIIKRSWIFWLFMLWMPLFVVILSCTSIYIALTQVTLSNLQYFIVGGNILMSVLVTISSLNYVRHFKSIHHEPEIINDPHRLRDELDTWDKYFQSFFNWSITNQWILVAIIIAEVVLIFTSPKVSTYFGYFIIDIIMMIIEIGLLRKYRKKMMDLEMDYNIFVPWKIFFINQSGLLSVVQSIEWDKIKTVQSVFPSKIASFFNYGTVNILTEWDTAMIGTMSMFYVTNPDKAVAYIQSLIDNSTPSTKNTETIDKKETPKKEKNHSNRHTIDTREKIRDVLR